ncbi:glycosyltransferase [Marinilabiliaceae bacterium JC017]|nr:glycosyltransferase [Marinilabiliaceae bacterium JC017]
MDKVFNKYLKRHGIEGLVSDYSAGHVGLSVVIPAYREKETLLRLLKSLQACDKPQGGVEVWVVVNYSEKDDLVVKQEQEALWQQTVDFAREGENSWLKIIPLKAFDLRSRDFGAGMARKIGMDQVAYYAFQAHDPNRVIVSLDADCMVGSNYFTELERWFDNKAHKGCTIRFEHPVEGDDFSESVYDAITEYELHLRYYLQALRETGFPYAYHTVGSCFAVRTEQYVRAGGMPRKHAGEDFYLLQKVIPMGGFGEVNTTCVIPSPRPSDRVPFGTGPVVQEAINNGCAYKTFNPQAFIDLKAFFDGYEKLFGISEADYDAFILSLSGRVRSFLVNSGFWGELENLNNNCASQSSFNRRFFNVFNAFKVVKYLNYVHHQFIEKREVYDAALDWLERKGIDTAELFETKDILKVYRELEIQGLHP